MCSPWAERGLTQAPRCMASRSVDQFRCQRLDPAQVALGHFGHTGAVFRVGLIKEGQDDVLALVIGGRQRAAEAVDQVLTLLLAERAIQSSSHRPDYHC